MLIMGLFLREIAQAYLICSFLAPLADAFVAGFSYFIHVLWLIPLGTNAGVITHFELTALLHSGSKEL